MILLALLPTYEPVPETTSALDPGQMVERSIAWLVADGCRRVPYRGIPRNEARWSLRVAAVNLRRLLALGLARQDAAWVLA
jgi:Transposase DDE domain